jgi:hypothetical protein
MAMKKRTPNFLASEDIALCKAYINCTLDSLVGEELKAELFYRWNAVLIQRQYCRYCCSCIVSSVDSIFYWRRVFVVAIVFVVFVAIMESKILFLVPQERSSPHKTCGEKDEKKF